MNLLPMISGAILLLITAAFSIRYAWWRPVVDWRRPRVLMYHMVSEPVPGAKFNGLRVAPAQFRKQLCWLRDNGFTFVTMQELAAASAAGTIRGKTVAITFDDGYEDNLVQALPLLRESGAKATLYLVVDRHDRDWSTAKKAHHASGELMRERKLSDEQVRELLASGVFELGAHTLTHANLARLDVAGKQREIAGSKLALEKTFGVPVNSFAYPFGIFDDADVDATRAAGFTNAVTTIDGIETAPIRDLFRIERVKVSGKDNFLAFVLRMRGGKRGLLK